MSEMLWHGVDGTSRPCAKLESSESEGGVRLLVDPAQGPSRHLVWTVQGQSLQIREVDDLAEDIESVSLMFSGESSLGEFRRGCDEGEGPQTDLECRDRDGEDLEGRPGA